MKLALEDEGEAVVSIYVQSLSQIYKEYEESGKYDTTKKQYKSPDIDSKAMEIYT